MLQKKKIYDILKSTKLFIDFLGKVFYFLFYLVVNPKRLDFKATLKYIETSAVDALLIVAVTAFWLELLLLIRSSSA